MDIKSGIFSIVAFLVGGFVVYSFDVMHQTNPQVADRYLSVVQQAKISSEDEATSPCEKVFMYSDESSGKGCLGGVLAQKDMEIKNLYGSIQSRLPAAILNAKNDYITNNEPLPSNLPIIQVPRLMKELNEKWQGYRDSLCENEAQSGSDGNGYSGFIDGCYIRMDDQYLKHLREMEWTWVQDINS